MFIPHSVQMPLEQSLHQPFRENLGRIQTFSWHANRKEKCFVSSRLLSRTEDSDIPKYHLLHGSHLEREIKEEQTSLSWFQNRLIHSLHIY